MKKTTVLDGKKFSLKMIRRISESISQIKSKYSFIPGLATIVVGEDPASLVYVKNKRKKAAEVGINSEEYRLSKREGEKTLLNLINKLNEDSNIDGILLQLPVPSYIETRSALDLILAEKDVDGFHTTNSGLLSSGRPNVIPCTPLGCLLLIREYFQTLDGKNVMIIGRSNIVGRPMANLLINHNATVTVSHSKSKNIPKLCKESDIIIAAVGKPKMVKSSWIKKGACVIDVGINRIYDEKGNGSLVGDVDYEEAKEVAGAITPVPGGVGPMTIACLLNNVAKLACERRGVAVPDKII